MNMQRRPTVVSNSAQRFPLAAKALRINTTPTLENPSMAETDLSVDKTKSKNNWPLYFFIFLLPLQNVQTGYIPNLGYGLNFLNVMGIASLIGAWMVGGKLAHGQLINRWALIYIIYAIVSLLIGMNTVSNTQDHVNMLKDQLIAVALLYIVQMSINDWSAVRRVIIATIMPMPYIAKVVWTQHISVSSYHYSDDLRIKGTFALIGANEFAAFCVTVAAIFFAAFIVAKLSKLWKLALLGAIACAVIGVIYAYSRTAYVAVLLAAVAIIFAWRGRWKLLVPVMLFAMILPAILPSSVIERFDSTTVKEGERDESTELRFEFWNIAWNKFTESPVVGYGFHTFSHKEINPYGKDTHNLYLRTLAEGGLIGFIILLGLLFSMFALSRQGMARAANGSIYYALSLGVLGAWFGLVLGNFFGDRFTHYPMIAYLWVYLGLIAKARDLPAERVTP